MNWMIRWAGAFPLFVDEATGARFRDVDGHDYVDFCLGDTGAMAGHGPRRRSPPSKRQLRRGITHMLPTQDAIVAADQLADASASGTGSSRSPRPTRTGSRSGSPARSPAARGPRPQPQLPRLGRRDVRLDAQGGVVAAAATSARRCPGRDHARRRDQRHRRLDRELAHGDVAVVLFEPA